MTISSPLLSIKYRRKECVASGVVHMLTHKTTLIAHWVSNIFAPVSLANHQSVIRRRSLLMERQHNHWWCPPNTRPNMNHRSPPYKEMLSLAVRFLLCHFIPFSNQTQQNRKTLQYQWTVSLLCHLVPLTPRSQICWPFNPRVEEWLLTVVKYDYPKQLIRGVSTSTSTTILFLKGAL